MGEFFKASELLEFAVQIEKNGELFYRTAAGKLKDSKVQDMFKFLADEEVKHKETYEKMLKPLESYEPKEVYPEEYFQYLRAYADQHVFVKKDAIEQKAAGVRSDREAIEIALGAEKDSILFYLEMKNMVPEADKKTIEDIVDEERRHYYKLAEAAKYLK